MHSLETSAGAHAFRIFYLRRELSRKIMKFLPRLFSLALFPSATHHYVIYTRPFYDADRSGGSSSASSAGTGSSTGGGPGNPAGGGRMAVIGVTRNVRLRRRGNAGFGFSLRGGREYAAGFYVSDVQPGGEAHRNGLRVLVLELLLFFSSGAKKYK